MKQKRDTVGKISQDLLGKTPDTRSPIELQEVMTENYLKELIECYNQARHAYAGDFFIVVLTKKEKLMPNVLRNYFFARATCPTPDYDQSVYRYNAKHDDIEFIWVVPSKWTCLYLLEHGREVAAEELGLLQLVIKFANGDLYKLAKKFNGEKDDTSELIS
ncbi:hypothetical protein M0R72_16370 [Candidatus Pacearchaeota archaeon]|jgi:hypothetical protein|nr:hypothetical protein [Candidatus Pacearchaeota archaeon]